MRFKVGLTLLIIGIVGLREQNEEAEEEENVTFFEIDFLFKFVYVSNYFC